jgi:hypothetical protein
MLKDVIVNLSGRGDFAAEYVAAGTFGANITGISFL